MCRVSGVGCSVKELLLCQFSMYPRLRVVANESQGYKRPLQWEDCFALPHSVETANVYPGYDAEWKKQLAVGELTVKVQHYSCSAHPPSMVELGSSALASLTQDLQCMSNLAV